MQRVCRSRIRSSIKAYWGWRVPHHKAHSATIIGCGPRDTIVGLETGGAAKAYPVSALQQMHVVNDRVGRNPVLVVYQPASDTTTAFIAEADGKMLRFKAAESAGRVIDLETHSIWNAYGDCVAGRLKGAHLKRLIPEPEFWFAWSEFHPNTALYVLPNHHKP